MPKTKAKVTNANSLVKRSGLGFDKTLLAVIALVVVATGGYLFFQGSHASSVPQSGYTSQQALNFTAPDGIRTTNYSYCMGYLAKNSAGNLFTRCVQYQTSTNRFRTVTYNLTLGKFTPDAWIGGQSVASESKHSAPFCKNDGNYFVGWGPVSGTTYYGQEYRPVAQSTANPRAWQIAFASYSSVTGVCSLSSAWYPIFNSLVTSG